MEEKYNCILFDGTDLIENAVVVVENGIVTSIERSNEVIDKRYFIMPCMIDAHTHMNNMEQANKMIRYGISSTFDVSASDSLINQSLDLKIISSIDMAMGIVLKPKKFVQSAIKKGAKYIKVLLFDSLLIGKKALKGIVEEAHKNNLKVVVHATEISTYKQAIECGADIILHLPIKEEITDELATLIKEKGIYVVPTLVMMEAFSKSGRKGYKEEHYLNAERQIQTLYKNGVQILLGTDANMGTFAPKVNYGDSLYDEINLLIKAGLPLIDVLTGVTSKIGAAFNMKDIGKIEVGKPVNMLLFDINNGDVLIRYDNLKKIFINGKEII